MIDKNVFVICGQTRAAVAASRTVRNPARVIFPSTAPRPLPGRRSSDPFGSQSPSPIIAHVSRNPVNQLILPCDPNAFVSIDTYKYICTRVPSVSLYPATTAAPLMSRVPRNSNRHLLGRVARLSRAPYIIDRSRPYGRRAAVILTPDGGSRGDGYGTRSARRRRANNSADDDDDGDERASESFPPRQC